MASTSSSFRGLPIFASSAITLPLHLTYSFEFLRTPYFQAKLSTFDAPHIEAPCNSAFYISRLAPRLNSPVKIPPALCYHYTQFPLPLGPTASHLTSITVVTALECR